MCDTIAVLVEKADEQDLDPVIGALHGLADSLQELGESPIGQGTPAAAEAKELAQLLRQAAVGLSLPPGHPSLPDAAKQVLTLLEEAARHYGVWPEDGGPGKGRELPRAGEGE